MPRKLRRFGSPQNPILNTLFGVNVGEFPKHHFTYTGWEEIRRPILPIFAGVDENVKYWWRVRTESNLFALEWVRDGEFRFEQNDRIYFCKSGDLFLVHPDVNSRMSCESEYAVKWTIAFTGELLRPLLTSLHLNRIDRIERLPEQPFEEYFKAIFALMGQHSDASADEASALSYQLLLQLAGRTEEPKYGPVITRALAYLEEHCTESPDIDTLAEKCATSRRMLFLLFRTELNTTPVMFLRKLRLEKAANLLRSNRLSIKENARNAGYDDPLYFSRLFKLHYGVSPTEFRSAEDSSRE